uniref:Uncharacterized protein n=1 Tax=Hyaloperonospora arabidopsidis (strain Emoy2) TaxID=559515 RepID=M4BPM0_HYAAE
MGDKKSGMFDVNWQKIWPDRMPVILRDLAPTNPFNPRNLWPEESKDDAVPAPEATSATSAIPTSTDKKPSAGGIVKKADLIRMQLAKEKAQKQSKVDEEKLMNIKKAKNLLDMKMVTPTGRLKQLYEILRESCKKKEFTDAVDTLWEIQRTNLVPKRASIEGRKKLHEKQKKMDDDEHLKLQADFNAVHKKTIRLLCVHQRVRARRCSRPTCRLSAAACCLLSRRIPLRGKWPRCSRQW